MHKPHSSLWWTLVQRCLDVSAQFRLPNEEGGRAISSNKFRSPPVMWNLSQLKYLPVDAVKESKEPGDDERQLSAGHSVCSILMGSPDTHKSIKEEALKQMSSLWTRWARPNVFFREAVLGNIFNWTRSTVVSKLKRYFLVRFYLTQLYLSFYSV